MKNKDVLAMEKAKIVEKMFWSRPKRCWWSRMQQSWHREVYAS